MNIEAAVLLALFAMLVGVALGVMLTRAAQSHLADLVDTVRVEPPPLASTAAPGVRERYLEELRPVARAALGSRDGCPPDAEAVERLARALSAVAADAWALGVGQLREAIVHGSGLSPELADFAVTTALGSMGRAGR